MESTRLAERRGVAVLAGTDCGVYGVEVEDVWQEMRLVREATGSDWTALASATSAAADALGRADLEICRLGRWLTSSSSRLTH